jgi:hypothetical protein
MEAGRQDSALAIRGVRMQVGMHDSREATVGPFDLGYPGSGHEAQSEPRRMGRLAPTRCSLVGGLGPAGSPSTMQELGGTERRRPRFAASTLGGPTLKRASGRADGDAKADARVRELFEDLEPSGELPPKGVTDDGARHVKLANQYLSVKSLRGKGPKKRPSQEIVVRGRVSAQDFGEGRSRGVELDGDDEPARHVDAMNTPPVLHELERPAGFAAVQGAEEITESRRTKSAW